MKGGYAEWGGGSGTAAARRNIGSFGDHLLASGMSTPSQQLLLLVEFMEAGDSGRSL